MCNKSPYIRSVTLIITNSLVMCVLAMSMGAYDEEEHERREQKNSSVDVSFDDERTNYEGKVTFDNGESADELLNQFKQIKSE